MKAALPPAIARGLVFALTPLVWMPSSVSCSASPSHRELRASQPTPCVYKYIYMYRQQAHFTATINKHRAALYFVGRKSLLPACALPDGAGAVTGARQDWFHWEGLGWHSLRPTL